MSRVPSILEDSRDGVPTRPGQLRGWLHDFGHRYIRDIVFAANDGIVTTLAAVTVSHGMRLAPWMVFAIGFANLAADGFSMAAGNYLGIKSERGTLAEQAETPRQRTVRAAKHGAVTWGAFLVAGMMPLIPFLFAGVLPNPFVFSIGAAGATLFSVGASRTFVTGRSPVRGGLEMLFVGALAGMVAYAAGRAVQHIGGWGR